MSRLSRRGVLRLAGAAGATLALGARAARRGDAGDDGDADLDVAVIGGGVAGLYVAWSLRTRIGGADTPPPEVALFEASERLGGRLYSAAVPDAPHLNGELGGMRFLTAQPLVINLCRQLGLATKPFGDSSDHDLHYLRGVRFDGRDIAARSPRIPYDLPGEYRGMSPGGVVAALARELMPQAGLLSPEDWRAAKGELTAFGRPLYDWALTDLLLRALPPDVFEYVRDGLGYALTGLDYNALEGLEDFVGTIASAPEYVTPEQGCQALPLTLARRFREAGGLLETGVRLRLIERTGPSPDAPLRLTLEQDGALRTLRARHVVLALPRRAIELLDPRTFLFDDAGFRRDLRAVVGVRTSKILLAFEAPWWAPLGIGGGTSTTDLPMRQCVYHGAEEEQPGGEPGNTRALLTGSYALGLPAAYWEDFLDNPPEPGTHTPYPARGPVPADAVAPAALVRANVAQLAELHGVPVPAPYWAAYMDWTRDPYGGAFHFWEAGEHSWEVIGRMRRPVAGANVSICGEAWSGEQGWAEGALQTAERVLQTQFGAAWPAWLPAGSDIGP